jgi:hypothetical protein
MDGSSQNAILEVADEPMPEGLPLLTEALEKQPKEANPSGEARPDYYMMIALSIEVAVRYR